MLRSVAMLTLARLCSAHRRTVLIGWVVVLLGAGFGWQAIGSHYANNFTLGHTGAQRAADLLQSAFPSQAGDSDQIVFKTRAGRFDTPATRAAVAPMLARVAQLPHVTGVISPYQPGGGERISLSGTIAFATVLFDQRANVLPEGAIKNVIATAEAIRSSRLEVELGGQAIEQTEFAKPTATTAIGVLAAIVVLLVSFGSFLAMGLPILTALLGLGTGISLVGLISHALAMPNFSIELGAMIGLGVGIDYALFILSRYREIYRQNGGRVHEAVALAMDMAGRAVLFAGATVVIALLGMFALGVSFLYGLAIAASLAVLLVLAASITLLPALLTLLGRRVGEPGRLARRFARRRGERVRVGFWGRWIAVIQRRPALAALAASAVMVLLAAPALSLRLGTSDSGNDPSSFTTRHAYDLLAQGFGPGFNGPLSLAVKLSHKNERRRSPGSPRRCRAPRCRRRRAPAPEPGRQRGRAQRLPRFLTPEQRDDNARQGAPQPHHPAARNGHRHASVRRRPDRDFIDFSSVLSSSSGSSSRSSSRSRRCSCSSSSAHS